MVWKELKLVIMSFGFGRCPKCGEPGEIITDGKVRWSGIPSPKYCVECDIRY